MTKQKIHTDNHGEQYFVTYREVAEITTDLPDKQCGEFFVSFLDYIWDDKLPEDPMMKALVLLATVANRLWEETMERTDGRETDVHEEGN